MTSLTPSYLLWPECLAIQPPTIVTLLASLQQHDTGTCAHLIVPATQVHMGPFVLTGLEKQHPDLAANYVS